MRAAWCLLLIGLAGCGDASQTTEVPDEVLDTGALEGSLVDASITPIADATIRAGDAATLSDSNGAWRLEGLPPGSYIVQATKPGFAAGQATATVVAGTTVDVSIQLVRNLTAEPFIVQDTWEGFIECSTRIGTGGASGSIGLNVCDDVGRQDVHRVHEFPDGAPDWFQTELQWDSTQVAGSDLSLLVGPETCLDPKYQRKDGGSPLVYNMDAFETHARELGPDAGLCTRVFTWTSGDLQHVAGVQFQQTFSGFSHAFYNMLPDDGWLFVQDGEHP